VTVVDSDVLIRLLRGDPGVAERLAAVQRCDTLACSVITSFEVLRGATPSQMRRTSELIDSLVQLPVNADIARAAAREWSTHRGANQTLSMADTLIGCTAQLQGCPLLTGNPRHYPFVGLTLLPSE